MANKDFSAVTTVHNMFFGNSRNSALPNSQYNPPNTKTAPPLAQFLQYKAYTTQLHNSVSTQ